MSITKKIISLITGSVICLVVVLSIVSYLLISSSSDETTQKSLDRYLETVQANIQDSLDTYVAFGSMVTDDEDLSKAVAQGDLETIKKIAKNIESLPVIELVTICDINGKVLARGHNDQAGDTLGSSRLSSTVPLKEGKSITGMEPGTATRLTLASGSPLIHQGQRVGAIILGEILSSGEFVNHIKKMMGVECTIFLGDTRVATTMMRDGKPLIDTPLNNPKISDAVLLRGETVRSPSVINGQQFTSIYWPWKDMSGKIAGMFFIGYPLAEVQAMQRTVVIFFIIAGVVLGIILIIVGILMAKAISRPLIRATDFATAGAGGDFSQELNYSGKDEVGVLSRSMQSMVSTLKEKIAESDAKSKEAERESSRANEALVEAKKATEQSQKSQEAILRTAKDVEDVVIRLGGVTRELTGQIAKADNSAQEQRDRIASSATAMEEMNATVLEVARNAATASEASERAREKARQGEKIVERSVNAIKKVRDDTISLKDNMEQLGKQAESIGTVMGVISDIADQTNLLALNAAIEAARAGEAGRGFAVVADEVRKLAEKTMTATKEVGSAIQGIQASARASIGAVETSTGNLETATELVNESGQSLVEIVQESVHSADQVRSIATAAEEQSASSSEIASSIESINAIAVETAGAMDQADKAVKDLSEQTQQLTNLVNALRK